MASVFPGRKQLAPECGQHPGEAAISPNIQHAERRAYATALGEPLPSASLDYLGREAKTHFAEHHGLSFAQYMQRSLTLLPPEMWKSNGEHLVPLKAIWLKAHESEYRKGQSLSLPEGIEDITDALWIFGKARPQSYHMRQLGSALIFKRVEGRELGKEFPLPQGSFFGALLAGQAGVQVLSLSEPSAKGEAWMENVNGMLPDLFSCRKPKTIQLKTDLAHITIAPMTKPAWATAIGQDIYGLFVEFEIKGLIQKMRWINPGRFMMGSPENEAERENHEVQHEVIFSEGYWLSETACTQALWEAVTGENPSKFKNPEHPIETVNWENVQEFITRLNNKVLGLAVRLPTEAEWEHACRAGTTTPFSIGENITTDQVNYHGNYPYVGGKKGKYRKKTVEVKALPVNQWGFYQMHGNVWEWCSDWYGAYPTEPVTDSLGPESGDSRVLRGGSWIYKGRDVRSACRYHYDPSFRYANIGFRLARGQKRPGE